jgi:uncharacterized damage-inducible protein DinB
VELADPVRYARTGAPPFLILHGRADTSIPPDQSRYLFDAPVNFGNQVTLALFENLKHGFLSNPRLAEEHDGEFTIKQSDAAHNAWTFDPAADVISIVRSFLQAHLLVCPEYYRRLVFRCPSFLTFTFIHLALLRRCSMKCDFMAINPTDIPRMRAHSLQHALDTYASEVNKVVSVWREFEDADLDFRPHPKSSTVEEILKHQLLSERRFFAEFLGTSEPASDEVLPDALTIENCCRRIAISAKTRLSFLANQEESWWFAVVPFFDVRRERIWILWRRILHTAHHRTQLTVYLRLLNKPVPSTYGPTSDVSWQGADPTTSVEAASRK